MITPRQKLTDGDYTIGLTKHQCIELFQIDGYVPYEYYTIKCMQHGIMFQANELFVADEPDENTTEYDFPDFKQLCENTFGV